jgi:hypothetical protein
VVRLLRGLTIGAVVRGHDLQKSLVDQEPDRRPAVPDVAAAGEPSFEFRAHGTVPTAPSVVRDIAR